MRPLDPRLRGPLAPARRPLAGVLVAGVLARPLVVAQAFAVAAPGRRRCWRATAGRRLGAAASWRCSPPGRGPAWLADVAAARAAGRGRRAPAAPAACAVLATRPAGGCRRRRTGELAALATRGVTRASEPYLTRYLPALVLAAVVLPPLTVVAIATQDLLSAVDRAGHAAAGAGLRAPSSAWPPGTAPSRSGGRWPRCPGHFLDVVRGLPTLVAFRRAQAQSATIRRVTDALPARPRMDTLRIAFASSAVLELVATLSVALVAVTVGVRLAGRRPRPAAPRWWCCCSPRRRTGRCAGSAPSSTPPPRASRRSRRRATSPALPDARADAAAGPAPHGPLVARGLRRACTRAGRRRRWPPSTLVAARPRGHGRSTGPSGCGKSTLLAALAGLRRAHVRHRPDGGRLGRVRGAEWRRHLALPQRPVFVAGTVADNLRLARPDATDDRLWDALRRVALAERVRSLPDGLDTPLGEDGADALRRRAGPAGAGPGGARGPALGAARRADRPPRRGDRAGHRRHGRGAGRAPAASSWSPTARAIVALADRVVDAAGSRPATRTTGGRTACRPSRPRPRR